MRYFVTGSEFAYGACQCTITPPVVESIEVTILVIASGAVLALID